MAISKRAKEAKCPTAVNKGANTNHKGHKKRECEQSCQIDAPIH